jgi:predicted DNA-binding ArsR family transcriptional regulator
MNIRIAILLGAIGTIAAIRGVQAENEGWVHKELTSNEVTRVEARLATVQSGMSDDNILDHLGILKGGYISGGMGGGPQIRYRTTYRVGESGILIIVRNRTNLTEVVFWNRATGKKTTKKIEKPSG